MTDTNESRQKLIEKIQKILNLAARGGTEAEAAAAAAKAQELLAMHNMSMADMETQARKNDWVENMDLETRDVAWFRPIMQGAAHLYFCGYFYIHTAGKCRHIFVGKPANTIVAQMMSAYLITTVRRLAARAAKSAPKEDRGRFTSSFKIACANRLNDRMAHRAEMTKRQATPSGIGGSNLPALRSMYDEVEDMLAAYRESHNIRVAKTKTRASHGAGYSAGYSAADGISLDGQVGGSTGSGQSIGRTKVVTKS